MIGKIIIQVCIVLFAVSTSADLVIGDAVCTINIASVCNSSIVLSF